MTQGQPPPQKRKTRPVDVWTQSGALLLTPAGIIILAGGQYATDLVLSILSLSAATACLAALALRRLRPAAKLWNHIDAWLQPPLRKPAPKRRRAPASPQARLQLPLQGHRFGTTE